ncbi:hypothetical protein BUALT_Bualt09G0123400 [Buddleja alternifolia]|uniref:Protein NRT1/ PTR FAMILY 5.5-like n=1 Tax=Buddleja alternifolia TaxID=168488 RepID=A0AAV6X8M6_9LAMI|nr:hypothetical protein BUALT_Bualt09G0123400 [Buddleja alternifolia]
MAVIGRTIVLLWADMMAMYTLFIMMTYLTNVWKLGFTHAAAIINVFWGLSLTLPLLLKFIVDTISGNFWMLLISSIAYCAGMGFLTMSTPPVLANAMGTCSEYKPECIGQGQKILFYTALPLIALGLSGHLTSWNSLLSEQLGNDITGIFFEQTENSDEEMDDSDVEDKVVFHRFLCAFFRIFSGIYFVAIVVVTAITVVTYIKPWSIRFGIPAICTVFATLLFLTSFCSFNYVEPQGSPITTFFRVIVASITKLLYRSPKDHKQLYEKQDPEDKLVPHTRSLRCLDKAAIVLPLQSLEEQKKKRWRLCTVTEVENTKIIIRMIPITMTLIMCGVVTSIGFTYFVEQINHLNPKFIFFKVPLPVFLGVYQLANGAGGSSYNLIQLLEKCFSRSKPRNCAPSIGIAISMVFAILCCITAAKVENRRLGVVQKHGLEDKPDDRVPMSMFWMLPQFVLLGMNNGLLDRSIISFYTNQYPVSRHNMYVPLSPVSPNDMYLPFVTSGVIGVGTLCGVLSVYVVGKVSERGGKMNWFQHNLNGSRLDKYYWTLSWLMAINLVVFIVVAIFYRYKESDNDNEEEEEGGEGGEIGEVNDDDNVANCCCCG